MRKVSKYIAAIMIAVAYLSLLAQWRSSESELYWSDEDWDRAFIESYGYTFPEYFVLGEEGFMASWLEPEEDKRTKCVFNNHCVHIRLVTISHCEKGGIVKFDVLDSSDHVISSNTSEVFWLQPGGELLLELGSKELDEQKFVSPTAALCSENLPEV